MQLIDRVTELAENGAEDVTGVRTGFYEMDRMMAGMLKLSFVTPAKNSQMLLASD